MTLSIRHQIINCLVKYLEDYNWQTMSLNVVPGRTVFDPAVDPLPLLAIIPGLEEVEKLNYASDKITMPVDLSALIKLDKQTGLVDDAIYISEPIKAEIHKAACLAARSTGLIDLVDTIQYTGGGVAEWPTGMSQKVITVGVSLAVIYKTKTGDPFTGG